MVFFVDIRAKSEYSTAMSDETTITTRELLGFIGADDKAGMDRLQAWVREGLFDMAGCAPLERHIGRGRARTYPAAARHWAAAIRRLTDRRLAGFQIGQMLSFLRINQAAARQLSDGRPDLIGEAMGGRADVWALFALGDGGPPGTPGLITGFKVVAGRPDVPEGYGTMAISLNLGWLFSRVA